MEKFREYTFETAKLYVELYKWYPMPPTVHEVLLHGGDIINAFELPIGYFTEEAIESRNEIRKFGSSEHFSHERKTGNPQTEMFFTGFFCPRTLSFPATFRW